MEILAKLIFITGVVLLLISITSGILLLMEELNEQVDVVELPVRMDMIENDGKPTPLHRGVDYEAGVVCWWISLDSIECLPIEGTLLKGK